MSIKTNTEKPLWKKWWFWGIVLFAGFILLGASGSSEREEISAYKETIAIYEDIREIDDEIIVGSGQVLLLASDGIQAMVDSDFDRLDEITVEIGVVSPQIEEWMIARNALLEKLEK